MAELTNRQSLPAISQVTSSSHDEFTKSDKVCVLVSELEDIGKSADSSAC
jgi:hypothetical protein